MIKKSNRLEIKNLTKELIFSSGGITRREISEKTGLDVRTCSSYVDELLKQGLICERAAGQNAAGRPPSIYCLNADKLLFLGIVLRTESISSSLIDMDNNIIKESRENIGIEDESKLRVINRIFDIIDDNIKAFPEKRIAGICISVSRWLRPPLSFLDTFAEIAEIVFRRTGIAVFRELPINTLVYDMREENPKARNIVLFHTGKVIELGIMKDGIVPENTLLIEYELSHTEAERNGELCYCGGTGCLEHYVTDAAVKEMLSKIQTADNKNISLEDGLLKGFPGYRELADKLSEYCRLAFEKLYGKYKPEIFGYVGLAPEIWKKAIGKFNETGGRKVKFVKAGGVDTTYSAALAASYKTVKDFIR